MIDYDDEAMDSIVNGDVERLKSLASRHEDFPNGRDSLLERHWITNAVDCGTFEVVEWMLGEGVTIDFRDEEGNTPLHSALDRTLPDKHRILELLCSSGANVNAHGFNDWTPLHMAAARNDVESLRILLAHGANRYMKTRIDDYATPVEEAKNLNRLWDCSDAVKFLEEYGR